MKPFLISQPNGTLMRIRLQPGASKTEISGIHGDELKIRILAPPVDGKANAATQAFLAETLKVAKNRVQLVHGASSRSKVFFVEGLNVDEVRGRLSLP